ncbi:MAG TPA: hypothetical protein DEV81_22850 [Cyanobacteria bacterium UBA11049]|nr:hypothetical protein [Cyanobacteria bacterium UBA11049]
MEVIHPHCAGLDVQKKTVCACCIKPGARGEKTSQIRNFNNTIQDLLALSDWLGSNSITHVALDITGEDWKTLYHLLEANFNVLVLNAQRVKDVPGRNTQIADAEWMAELLRHGLVRSSFIHPVPQRDLRDLIRHRHYLAQERASAVNRLYIVLESANLKLFSQVSDVTQISARIMLEAIAQGKNPLYDVTDLARISLRQQQQSEQAYFRQVRSHHRFLIASYLDRIDFIDRQISVFNTKIAEYIQTKINRTAIQNSNQNQIQATTQSNTSTSTKTAAAKLIPTWEEALAAFLNGKRV